MSGLIGILIAIIILVVICYIGFWIIDSAFPEPIRLVAKVVVGVVALLELLNLVTGSGFHF
jgi:hypothetical protein